MSPVPLVGVGRYRFSHYKRAFLTWYGWAPTLTGAQPVGVLVRVARAKEVAGAG